MFTLPECQVLSHPKANTLANRFVSHFLRIVGSSGNAHTIVFEYQTWRSHELVTFRQLKHVVFVWEFGYASKTNMLKEMWIFTLALLCAPSVEVQRCSVLTKRRE